MTAEEHGANIVRPQSVSVEANKAKKEQERTNTDQPLKTLGFWETVYLLADSWQREIHYNDLMKKNYESLYARTGMHGTTWAYGNGAAYAIVFRIIRAILLRIIVKSWLRYASAAYITWKTVSRIIRLYVYLKTSHVSNRWNTFCLSFWTIWLFICIIYFKPENQWLADYAVRRCLLGPIAAFIQFAKADDAMQWNVIHWHAQLQSLGAYALTSYLMYSDNAFSTIRAIVFWYMNFSFYWSLLAADTRLIALCWVAIERSFTYLGLRVWLQTATFIIFTLGPVIYSFWRFFIDSAALPRPKTRIPLRIKVWLVKQTYPLDRLEYWEAFFMYIVPTFLLTVAHGVNQTQQHELLNDEEKAKMYKRWTGMNLPVGENPQEIKIPQYEYQPLAADEIRILVIAPLTSLYQDMSLTIEHCKLSEAGEYEALSYCWGDQELSEEIKIEGKRLPITLSALDFLIARCALGRQRRVWIDAVCINQNDPQEKADQVALMYSIYSQASRVLLMPIPVSAARLAAGLLYEVKTAPNNWSFNHDLHLRGLLTNTTLDFKVHTMRWKALANLLTNVYFSRAWIMQEIVAAKSPELYLGGLYLPWDDFCTAVERLSIVEYQHALAAIWYGARMPKDAVTIRNNAIIMLNGLRKEQASSEMMHGAAYLKRLDNLLDIAAEFNCTDPRDKIYALTGMSNDKFVVPDYTRDYLDVLKDTTRALLKDQRINILAMAGIGSQGAHAISWLPDLARQRPPPFTIPHVTKPRFQPTTAPAHIDVQGDEVSVSGFMVDAIMEVSEALLDQSSGTISPESQIAFHKAAFELARRHGKSDKEITLTMVAEREVTTIFESYQNRKTEWYDDEAMRYAEYVEAEMKLGAVESSKDYIGESARLYRGYIRSAGQSCLGRLFGITIHGRLCLVPELSQPGDIVCVLDGAQVPYLLRSAGEGDVCQLVGEAYVHGIMHGGAVPEHRRSFVLI